MFNWDKKYLSWKYYVKLLILLFQLRYHFPGWASRQVQNLEELQHSGFALTLWKITQEIRDVPVLLIASRAYESTYEKDLPSLTWAKYNLIQTFQELSAIQGSVAQYPTLQHWQHW